jgi:pyruvate dehydrogenase (quinone)/pyruvate oxidase
VQVADADADPYQHVAPATPPATSATRAYPIGIPREQDLRAAAEVLSSAERPAILAGVGALHAREEVLAVAELLGAPVVKTLPGKAAIPDDSEFAVGGIGLLGTKPGSELMDDCDVLFMVGTNFPYTKHLPSPDAIKVVQVDADASRIGARLPISVGLVGDAKETLAALAPMLSRRDDRAHLEKYQKAMGEWRSNMEALENEDRSPIAPQYLMSVIDAAADDDAVLTCDSGTIATWAARHWTIRGDREFYLSGNLATMAPGLPYANAIQHAYPGRQVIAFVGDGGFAMLMAEFLTAAQHGWPITVVVNNNNSLGQILWEQMVLGYPEHGVRFEKPEGNFAAWAEACGGYGRR